MRGWKHVVVFMLLLAVSDTNGTICFEQRPANVRYVRGVVVAEFDALLCPLAGVEVELRRGKFQQKATTDEDGYFAFSKIAPGPYTLSTHLEGLEDITEAPVTLEDSLPADGVIFVHMTVSELISCGGSVSVVSAEEAQAIQKKPKCRETNAPPN